MYASVRHFEDSVKFDMAVRYPVPRGDIEETKREVEGEVAEAGKELCSAPFPFTARTRKRAFLGGRGMILRTLNLADRHQHVAVLQATRV